MASRNSSSLTLTSNPGCPFFLGGRRRALGVASQKCKIIEEDLKDVKDSREISPTQTECRDIWRNIELMRVENEYHGDK